MCPSDTQDDDWSPGAALIRSVGYGLMAGLAMGLAYFLLIWLLQDWLRSTSFRNTYYGRYHTPLVLLPFFLASAGYAWGNLRLAERISGACGFVLMIPVSGTAAAAMGVALALTRATIAPWSNHFWWTFLVLGVGMVGGPLIRILRSG
ncbi:MAG: hypothetical protein GY778_24940 [bacterium]|nr:hypothetical protein [bacterium]